MLKNKIMREKYEKLRKKEIYKQQLKRDKKNNLIHSFAHTN